MWDNTTDLQSVEVRVSTDNLHSKVSDCLKLLLTTNESLSKIGSSIESARRPKAGKAIVENNGCRSLRETVNLLPFNM